MDDSAHSTSVERVLQALLRLHDTPARTAAALALGVFFSFSPFLGLQIVLSMALAFSLGLNRVAVFLGLNANLPWFIAPWYVATTAAAAAVLGVASPESISRDLRQLLESGWLTLAFWNQVRTTLRPLVVPFLIGPTVASAGVACLTFLVARACLVRRATTAALSVHQG